MFNKTYCACLCKKKDNGDERQNTKEHRREPMVVFLLLLPMESYLCLLNISITVSCHIFLMYECAQHQQAPHMHRESKASVSF